MTVRQVNCVSLGLCLVFSAGCNDSQHTTPRDIVDVEEDAPTPFEEPGPPLTTAPSVRRLSVDQLDASVQTVAGPDIHGNPIEWRYSIDDVEYNAYDDRAFGEALGRADFVTLTQHDLSASPHYVKFARDMAIAVTHSMITADLRRADPADATIWPFAPVESQADAEQINRNVRYLALRFWGLDLAEDDPHVQALVSVFDAAVADLDRPELLPYRPEVEGWRAVCVALFTDPAFHLY